MKYISFLVLALFLLPITASASEVVDITFPVDGTYTFQDDFGDPRGGGRSHAGVDIMAAKMTPVVAAVSGKIVFAPSPEPSYGYMLELRGDDGYDYFYIHLNNDTPGTDDGNGGTQYAYAPGIGKGVQVTRGQLLGWLGDSGNAEHTAPHLHFEIRHRDGTPINPYASLIAAEQSASQPGSNLQPVSTSPTLTINEDKQIPQATGPVNCESDSLIKVATSSTVYYCGQDGGRYVFQNERMYFSWYDDYEDIQTISAEQMASIPLKGVVTYKPGSFLVKLQTNPKVYHVTENGTLRWVTTPTVAASLFGVNWASHVHDLSDSFFPAYTIGEDMK